MSNRDRIAVLSEICPFGYKDSNILQKNDNLPQEVVVINAAKSGFFVVLL
jgi:hypothetical protein